MESTARRIAEDLLSIRAVFFRPDEPFTWASGIKSPVYCDNRLILTAPDVRTEVETALMQTIRREYPDAEVLMGTSTAGIAHAAITAQMMGLPMGYVRSSSKDHGRQNQIEGRLEKGQKVVVVEDLISTGGSVLEVVNVLREAGAEYGAKTGRPRRVGPIDLVATRYGVEVQGATNIALTKLDILSYMNEVPVCAAYEIDGEITHEFPFPAVLEKAKPVVKYLPGWGCDISGVRTWADMPQAARDYVEYVEQAIGCHIGYVSVGAERESLIIR